MSFLKFKKKKEAKIKQKALASPLGSYQLPIFVLNVWIQHLERVQGQTDHEANELQLPCN